MTAETKLAPNSSSKAQSQTSLIFITAYICQGVSQHFCLIAQPLNNFLKNGLHLDAGQVSYAVSALMLPWVIKPIYGLLADYFGFARAGLRRRRFLVAVHWLAACAYGCLGLTLAVNFAAINSVAGVPVVLALIVVAGLCIAFSTVIWVAMTVEASFKSESSRRYFGQQAVAYSAANIVSVYVGGLLSNSAAPRAALASSLCLAALPLAILPLILWRALASQTIVGAQVEEAQNSKEDSFLPALKSLGRERTYLLTLAFLALWNLSPSLGVSLYYYEQDVLKFSQGWIGTLGAVTSAGTLIGSIIFRYWLADFFARPRSTYILIALGTLSSAAYFFLHSPWSGVPIELLRGIIFMVTTLAIYGLAADVSPRGATATAMAVQIAVLNLAMEGSIAIGGQLYHNYFNRQLTPLIIVSCLTTLLTAFLVPFLSRRGCKQALNAGDNQA